MHKSECDIDMLGECIMSCHLLICVVWDVGCDILGVRESDSRGDFRRRKACWRYLSIGYEKPDEVGTSGCGDGCKVLS